MPVPDIGTDRQLFLDEAMIADLDGILEEAGVVPQ